MTIDNTPGPWVALSVDFNSSDPAQAEKLLDELDGCLYVISAPKWEGLAFVCGSADSAGGKANARLITAAPELLDALVLLVECGRKDLRNPKYDGYYDYARAAIKKAKEEMAP